MINLRGLDIPKMDLTLTSSSMLSTEDFYMSKPHRMGLGKICPPLPC